MSQQLPSRPNLDYLKKQAKDALRVFRRHKPQWKLADALHAVAHGYGFPNWSELKLHVEKVRGEHETILTRPGRALKGSLGVEPTHTDRSVHPITGTWIADRVQPALSNSQHPDENIVVEFTMAAGDVKLTQIATDATGRQVAVTMTVCVDGQEHSIPFGEGLMLQARWTTALELETTLKKDERIIGTATYEVSPDGRSLVVSSATQLVEFKRI